MTTGLLIGLVVFVLASFVGFEVINKVPPTLHTPLMSGANAISGIAVVGGLTYCRPQRVEYYHHFRLSCRGLSYHQRGGWLFGN